MRKSTPALHASLGLIRVLSVSLVWAVYPTWRWSCALTNHVPFTDISSTLTRHAALAADGICVRRGIRVPNRLPKAFRVRTAKV